MGDPLIAEALLEALSEWRALGVVAAERIAVNGPGPGVRIERSPRAQLWQRCSQPASYAGDGCSAYDDWEWTGMFIPDELTDYDRLRVVLLHELGHILSGDMGHLPDADGPAVMVLNATAAHPTAADVSWMAARTTVDAETAP